MKKKKKKKLGQVCKIFVFCKKSKNILKYVKFNLIIAMSLVKFVDIFCCHGFTYTGVEYVIT